MANQLNLNQLMHLIKHWLMNWQIHVSQLAMLKQLYFYYMEHIEELPQKYLVMLGQGDDKGRIICDYISGMTDQYATTKFHEYFVPVAWEIDGY